MEKRAGLLASPLGRACSCNLLIVVLMLKKSLVKLSFRKVVVKLSFRKVVVKLSFEKVVVKSLL